MFGIGASELLIIAVFALLFIGPKKLPELAKGLGKGIREFQKAKDDLMDQVNSPAPSSIEEEKEEQVASSEAAKDEDLQKNGHSNSSSDDENSNA
jgi:TatA/E family protein of Tat protein translocase